MKPEQAKLQEHIDALKEHGYVVVNPQVWELLCRTVQLNQAATNGRLEAEIARLRAELEEAVGLLRGLHEAREWDMERYEDTLFTDGAWDKIRAFLARHHGDSDD
jgi:hypothetical protein